MKAQNQDAQQEMLKANPELVMDYTPGIKYENIDQYVFDAPLPTEYAIGLLLDPCKVHLELNTDPEGKVLGGWDCCINVFGLPEYGQSPTKLMDNKDRRVDRYDLMELTEITRNVYKVNEQGDAISMLNSRRADDEIHFDELCAGLGDPYSYCVGYRKRQQRFQLYPNCTDHNTTVRADTKCFDMGQLTIDPANEHELQFNPIETNFCVQVAFMQTAHNMVCNDDLRTHLEMGSYANDVHCGTYLEVHMPAGTFYTEFDEDVIISEVKITSRYTSGYDTIVLPLYYRDRTDWVLCNYEEGYIRKGSMVMIKSTAPRCCCPKIFEDTTFEGHYFCPRNVQDVTVEGFSAGPFSTVIDTYDEMVLDEQQIDIYPYCPYYTDDQDVLMCSQLTAEDDKGEEISRYSQSTREGGAAYKQKRLTNLGSNTPIGKEVAGKRFFAEPCPKTMVLNKTHSPEDGFFASNALRGNYKFQCPYFEECAMPAGTKACNASRFRPNDDGLYNIYEADFEYSFRGFVGKVTYAPGEGEVGVPFQVSFNDGRTSYPFDEDDLQLERLAFNYELWWVQRTKYNFIVNKRKGFKVTNPTCTFDFNNNQYFPYAIVLNHTTCPLCLVTDPFGEQYVEEPCFAGTYPLAANDVPVCLLTLDQGYTTPSPDQDPMYDKYADYAGTRRRE